MAFKDSVARDLMCIYHKSYERESFVRIGVGGGNERGGTVTVTALALRLGNASRSSTRPLYSARDRDEGHNLLPPSLPVLCQIEMKCSTDTIREELTVGMHSDSTFFPLVLVR